MKIWNAESKNATRFVMGCCFDPFAFEAVLTIVCVLRTRGSLSIPSVSRNKFFHRIVLFCLAGLRPFIWLGLRVANGRFIRTSLLLLLLLGPGWSPLAGIGRKSKVAKFR